VSPSLSDGDGSEMHFVMVSLYVRCRGYSSKVVHTPQICFLKVLFGISGFSHKGSSLIKAFD
jgi:hypothetical protein